MDKTALKIQVTGFGAARLQVAAEKMPGVTVFDEWNGGFVALFTDKELGQLFFDAAQYRSELGGAVVRMERVFKTEKNGYWKNGDGQAVIVGGR